MFVVGDHVVCLLFVAVVVNTVVLKRKSAMLYPIPRQGKVDDLLETDYLPASFTFYFSFSS